MIPGSKAHDASNSEMSAEGIFVSYIKEFAGIIAMTAATFY